MPRLALALLFCICASAQPLFQRTDEMLNTLSEITGWKVRRKVPAKLLSRQAFRKQTEAQAKKADKRGVHVEELTLKMFGLVPDDFDLTAESVDLISEQAAAFYDYNKKQLFVLDGSQEGTEQEIALAHELAHLWLGQTALSDATLSETANHATETWCNRVAADHFSLDPARDLPLPGTHPYTRGIHPSGYRGKLWTMRQFAGFGTPEDTNQRYRQLLQAGGTGLSVAFDLPTLMGVDADDPAAKREDVLIERHGDDRAHDLLREQITGLFWRRRILSACRVRVDGQRTLGKVDVFQCLRERFARIGHERAVEGGRNLQDARTDGAPLQRRFSLANCLGRAREHDLFRGIAVGNDQPVVFLAQKGLDRLFIGLDGQHRAAIGAALRHELATQIGQAMQGLRRDAPGTTQGREFAVAVHVSIPQHYCMN
mgnify:CR=1 FL=1